jgi:hypothetical protein
MIIQYEAHPTTESEITRRWLQSVSCESLRALFPNTKCLARVARHKKAAERRACVRVRDWTESRRARREPNTCLIAAQQ